MATILAKFGLPLLLCALAFSGGMITNQKLTKPLVVKTEKCPDCICPEQQPCNGIDFDKIKGKYITLQNHQHLSFSGDSLIVQKLTEAFKRELQKELQAVKLARCK